MSALLFLGWHRRQRNVRKVSHFLYSLVFCLLLPFEDAAGVESKTNTTLERALREWKTEGAEDIRYIPSFADLNGDGKPEAIVYIYGATECGTGGCPTLILTPSEDGYKLVSEIVLTRPPIRVSPRKSHGWHNLVVFVAGGGIQQGYNAELEFNGKSYPDNPTVTPAKRVTDRVWGRIVIPWNISARDGIPLRKER